MICNDVQVDMRLRRAMSKGNQIQTNRTPIPRGVSPIYASRTSLPRPPVALHVHAVSASRIATRTHLRIADAAVMSRVARVQGRRRR